MARQLKALEVGVVHHKQSPQPVKIFYDRTSKKFYGVVTPPDRVEADTQAACESAVHAAIHATVALDWKRIIVVKYIEPFGYSSRDGPFIGFRFSRHEVAKLPAVKDAKWDKWVERTFTDPDVSADAPVNQDPFQHSGEDDWRKQGYDVHQFSYPDTDRETRENVVIPYTKSAWDGLSALQDRIVRAREQLREMLASPDVGNILAKAAAVPLLGPGNDGGTP